MHAGTRAAITFCLFLLLAGSVTTALESQNTVQDPRHARMYFLREKGITGLAMAPDILINGQKVGAVANGSFIFVDRPPGQYTVTVEQSLEPGRFVTDVRVSPGATYYFELGVNIINGRGVLLPKLAGNVGTPIDSRENTGGYRLNALDATTGAQIVAQLKS